jgi:hypothetical protein
MVKPSHRSQPYRRRKGAGRPTMPTGGLAALLRGATAAGQNPMDARRAAQKGLAARLRAARRR